MPIYPLADLEAFVQRTTMLKVAILIMYCALEVNRWLSLDLDLALPHLADSVKGIPYLSLFAILSRNPTVRKHEEYGPAP